MQKVFAPLSHHSFSHQSKVLTEISPLITGNIHFSRKTYPYSVRGDFKSYGNLTKNLCRPSHPPVRFQKPSEPDELDDLAVRVLRQRFYHPPAEPGVRSLAVVVFEKFIQNVPKPIASNASVRIDCCSIIYVNGVNINSPVVISDYESLGVFPKDIIRCRLGV